MLNTLPGPARKGEVGYDPVFAANVAKLGSVLDHANSKLNELRATSTALLPLPDCDVYDEILDDAKTSG